MGSEGFFAEQTPSLYLYLTGQAFVGLKKLHEKTSKKLAVTLKGKPPKQTKSYRTQKQKGRVVWESSEYRFAHTGSRKPCITFVALLSRKLSFLLLSCLCISLTGK